MRLFLSVDLPAPDLLGRGSASAAPAHLTVLFLGEVDARRLTALSEAIASALERFPAFPARLQGVGVFPNERSPRVLWVGVEEGAQELGRLHERLAGAVRSLGLRVEDRPFVPHLTIRRLRGSREFPEVLEILARHRGERFGRTEVTAVDLKQSRLERTGAVHETLVRFPLGAAAPPSRGP